MVCFKNVITEERMGFEDEGYVHPDNRRRAKPKVELVVFTPNGVGVADESASLCVGKSPDGKSLKHALKSGHESVLEHVSFTFKISGISRACSHQLVRHRLASYSQQSQRYVSEHSFEYVIPESIKKDGRADEQYSWAMKVIQKVYDDLVAHGIPKEDARYVLPNACTTSLIVTMNARELRHFFGLRCCNRAQWEIRDVANIMLAECKRVAPDIFTDAGAYCISRGFCTESRSCGKYPTLESIKKKMKEADSNE